MKQFGFESATMTVVYQVGLDDFNEPILKSSTFRNIAENISATQLDTVAQALFRLTDNSYVQVYKTEKQLIG